MNSTELLEIIKKFDNPSTIARKIDNYLVSSIEDKSISLYEGYLINGERLRFLYRSITETAWEREIGVYELIDFLNQKLLAQVFSTDTQNIIKMCNEVHKKCIKRKHYIFDIYEDLISQSPESPALVKLQEARDLNDFPDYYYPNHNTVFPFNSYSPENLLLNETKVEKEVNEDILDLIVKLSLTL